MNTILTEKDLLGIKEIDEQHEKLHKLASELKDAFLSNKTYDMKYLAEQIYEEMGNHFKTEERYMKENNCFEISHILEHQRYLEKTRHFIKALNNNQKNAVTEFLHSFRLWFYNHLELNDRKMVKNKNKDA